MIYTDAHCHIAPNIVGGFEIAGRIYNAARKSDWVTATEISDINDGKNFAAIGIHPWYVSDALHGWARTFEDIIITHPNMMIGEIGLDKYRPNMQRQIDIFSTQLRIAAENHRPIHLHCVGAWDRVLHIFRKNSKSMPPVVLAHGFSGNTNIMKILIEQYNTYFSYSVPRTDGQSLKRIIGTPETRILIESDTFNPHDQASKLWNATMAIAEIRGCNPNELSKQIEKNFNRVLDYVRPTAQNSSFIGQ